MISGGNPLALAFASSGMIKYVFIIILIIILMIAFSASRTLLYTAILGGIMFLAYTYIITSKNRPQPVYRPVYQPREVYRPPPYSQSVYQPVYQPAPPSTGSPAPAPAPQPKLYDQPRRPRTEQQRLELAQFIEQQKNDPNRVPHSVGKE